MGLLMAKWPFGLVESAALVVIEFAEQLLSKLLLLPRLVESQL